MTLSGNEYRTPLHTIVEKTGRVRSKKRPKENCVMGHGTYNLCVVDGARGPVAAPKNHVEEKRGLLLFTFPLFDQDGKSACMEIMRIVLIDCDPRILTGQ